MQQARDDENTQEELARQDEDAVQHETARDDETGSQRRARQKKDAHHHKHARQKHKCTKTHLGPDDFRKFSETVPSRVSDEENNRVISELAKSLTGKSMEQHVCLVCDQFRFRSEMKVTAKYFHNCNKPVLAGILVRTKRYEGLHDDCANQYNIMDKLCATDRERYPELQNCLLSPRAFNQHGQFGYCNECYNNLRLPNAKTKTRPKFAIANGNAIGRVMDPYLQDLTTAEILACSRV